MQQQSQPGYLYTQLARAVLLAAAAVVLLWLLYRLQAVLIFFATAFIAALILNAPVTWLEQRRVPRPLGVLLVAVGIVAGLAGLGFLVVPRLIGEVGNLAQNLPEYARMLFDNLSALLGDYPGLEEQLHLDVESLAQSLPSLPSLLGQVGGYTFSALGFVALLVVLLSVVFYTLLNPRPIVALYLQILPPDQRESGMRAFSRGSEMAVGWMKSNLIVGGLEAVASFAFLTFLGVPGALIWAALALFAELVPKLGPYLMAIPPIIVAAAVDPLEGLWVLLFYIALNEVMGDVVMPQVRASSMNLHPVYVLFATLAMASLFGILGALIATPLSGFLKAYFDEFYLSRREEAPRLAERTEAMLARRQDSGRKEQGVTEDGEAG
ncbi:MAG: AI-2E family transporter [Chloroflexota bacterium]